MTTESEYITDQLAQCRELLGTLPEQFAVAERENTRQIDLLCEAAGIMGAVQQHRNALKSTQKEIQSQADVLSGRINALDELNKQFHLAPIPDGVTHMYGIELAPLDPETRLKVMHGQEGASWAESITTLGGDPEFKDWDGTYEDEEDDEDEEENEDDPVLPPVPPPATAQPVPPPIDYAMFEGTDLVGIITGAGGPEEEPEDEDLDDIELAEIESRIEDDTATQEDLERVALMLSRARQVAEE
jgi:hypothetical protein